MDGQGNFGSVDNDPPAAMRYTEARLARIAEEMLVDIDRETVDFVPNFDSSLREPTVLPARLPNLLVNGTSGIAVGMATNIPPHNLSEVCDAIVYLIGHPEPEIDELIRIVHGPDFPTGATIMGREGINAAYRTGQGKVVIRAKAEIVDAEKGSRQQIIVSELPYQTNKAALIAKIAELLKDRRLDGISEIRDESDREGLRVVIELKRDATPEVVLNNLYKMTALQSAFFINVVALVDGQPRVLNLRQTLRAYVDFRVEVVTRRSQYDLRKAQERDHILEGLIKALDQLDAVIETIRRSDDVETARTNLMRGFGLSEAQAQAILDMQLRRLAALERQKILDEHQELQERIAYLQDLLAHPPKILGVVKTETQELKEEFGGARRTQISDQEARDYAVEDLIAHQDVVVSISNRGYAKRLGIDAYRIQRRGGQGVRGMITREQDVVEHLLIANTHDHILFFTNRGRVLHTKCWRIPQELTRAAKGTPLVNIIPLGTEERVTSVVATRDFEQDKYLFMATQRGRVLRTQLKEYVYIVTREKAIIGMRLQKDDELVSACVVVDSDNVIGVTRQGKALQFAVKEVTPHHRGAGGVRGMNLKKDDHLLTMGRVQEGSFLLVVGERGLGKLTKLESYTEHHRGTGGILTLRITPRTGPVAAARVVHPDEELMIISRGGIMIRTTLHQVRITGRAAQGVRIMEVDKDDVVASLAAFERREDEEPDPKAPKAAAPSGKPVTKAAPGASAPEDETDEEPAIEAEDAEEAEAEEARKRPALKKARPKPAAKKARPKSTPKKGRGEPASKKIGAKGTKKSKR